MTNKELQELLKQYPDDMMIGVERITAFGESWIATAGFVEIEKISDASSDHGTDCIVIK